LTTTTVEVGAEPAVLDHRVPSRRLVSLDAFRGLTIAGMILVNNPGSWSYVYGPLAHAEWHGWTPTDLIFPYFLFIVGVAIPFSFRRRLAEGADRMALFRHVVRRSLILVALGLLMRAVPDFDLADMRWPGVLQRIGLVYMAAAGLYLAAGPRARWGWTGGLLLGYWALMSWVPVPEYGAGNLSPEGNLAAWLDRLLMGGHLYREAWDPEGLLSTLPAVATSLLGLFTGEWLVSGKDGPRLTRGMMVAGVVLVPLGLLWGTVFPVNKNLWTSSYVVFTAGTALLLLGALYWVVDVRRRRGPWLTPLVVYGMNAIAVFVASGFMTKALVRIRVGSGDGVSLYSWIYQTAFQSWAGDYNGSLLFALSYVALWLGLMWLLYRRGVFIKI
jgi:predicted acyltransferase